MKKESQKYSEPFSHPRWNQIPAVRVVGSREITEEEKRRAEEYEKQYFAKREELKKKSEEQH